ncbi:Transcription factor [Sesamum angolense]|uniref:Transcription factor n=1 Tax=Sesamum angolense TaxID=2727404 RepID=A0AAE2BH87_9LAMI|nr:Transcription factor [Sesamum angolense]
MENCFWSEEYCASWNYGQAEVHKDGTLMVPWLPPAAADAAAAALQYHCYHPSADVAPWAAPFDGAAEDRTASASRSHSEAEKRRRDRINAQLATLRKLIPKSEKARTVINPVDIMYTQMDKAALLGQVVDHVKEQSERAKEVSKFSTIPTETDEVIIEHMNAQESAPQNIYMSATVCCDDRPELFAELNSALKGLAVTIVEAEITSLGGRTKSNFVLCAKDTGGAERNSCTSLLKQSLKLALNRVVISSGVSSYSARSKRQRFFHPNPR